jgi:tRNA1Val (adenine37-N6)-methyltransferase
MGVFRFKRFDVINEKSAMKVNTDGVLLGALMSIDPSDRNLLDIGTGTGTIALMAAQRLSSATGCSPDTEEVCIQAIDIDEASATEAGVNFRNSPWSGILHAFHTPLSDFSGTSEGRRYDLIFSNPPYFEDSLNAPEERRNNARHTSTGLSYREILEFAAERLSENGRVAFVLPAETEASLCRHARMSGLHLFRIVRVRTVPRKQPSRIIAEFSRSRIASPEDFILTIQNEGKYTSEYLSLMHDFYLFA